MHFISWNVNGLRAVLKKDFTKILSELDGDIVALQETKLQQNQIKFSTIQNELNELHGDTAPNYEDYWNCAVKKGYSGTAVFTRKSPLSVHYGMGIPRHDREGRILTLEFEDFWFVTVYVPNSKDKLKRLLYRMDWEQDFLNYLQQLENGISLSEAQLVPDNNPQKVALGEELILANYQSIETATGMDEAEKVKGNKRLDSSLWLPESKEAPKTKASAQAYDFWEKKEMHKKAGKPVIFCGDLNVAHTPIDLSNPETNHQNAGFSDEERAAFSTLTQEGFVDTFRHFYPDKTEVYSWWSYRTAARSRNIGWRIDYFCVSDALKAQLTEAKILSDVLGSDHCPVSLQINL